MVSKPVFAETVVIEPIVDIARFEQMVSETYVGSKISQKIGEDIISLLEKIKKGSYNIREDEYGTVFEKIFERRACEQEFEEKVWKEFEGECCESNDLFKVSLEAFETHCSEIRETAYVPVLIFHACGINNERLSMLSADIGFYADGIKPSSIPGMVALCYSVGGY